MAPIHPRVGSTFVVEGHAFTIVGVSPPDGFFGDTLRGDPPDIWIPVQKEPLIVGRQCACLRQSVSAWLRVIGRLHPGASVTGMEPRLTGVLRQWMLHDSGYPSNWMSDINRLIPQAGDQCCARRLRRCRGDEGRIWPDSTNICLPFAAWYC